ncbi:hypothetical protein MNBD_GAMMA01-2012, partial [hydrothermal vent metagenome]
MRQLIIILTTFVFFNLALASDAIIRTDNSGFYIVKPSQQALKKLSLLNTEGIKPYFIDDDKIIFFSQMLHGATTYQHLLDDYNGYVLSTNKKKNKFKRWLFNEKKLKKLPVCNAIYTIDHLESNELLIRVNTKQYTQTPELWYWKKISQINKQGFSVPLDFAKVDSTDSVSIQVAFRGISQDIHAKNIADHEVHVLFNGTKIETFNWQGKTQYASEGINIPANLIKAAENQITFLVPKRVDSKNRILDVVMLDYIKVKFAINKEQITDGYGLFSDEKCRVVLNKNQFAYSTRDKKFAFKNIALSPDDMVYIGNYGSLQQATIKPMSQLNADLSETEYVMISHPLFIDAITPLADFYRQQGMSVAVVDINTIYTHYSYGVRELYAIKDFIKQTYIAGDGKLSHVLLVGDSSWDWRESKKYLDKYSSWANRTAPLTRNFVNQPHFAYKDDIQNRDFVPTGQFHSTDGHSASDNWFVSIIPEKSIKGEDYIPDIAIGRFTVATVEEANAMVAKSINYQTNAKVGPWKSRVLWITNADKRYQNFSNAIAYRIGKQGAVAENIFPEKMDGDNLEVQETLTNAMNEGDLIVHFVGHGGNSIWRIGPPDIKKNRDLFTLDHISDLQNKDALPFVMSMSCYSAPYDHPIADSIGEKFLREKDKGAIAVLAASWRNTPRQAFSRAVIDNIYKTPRQSLGQAILHAKRYYKGRVAVEMYNLLGDPALHLALPALTINTEINYANNLAKLRIDSEKFAGKVNIEFADKANKVIKKLQLQLSSPDFTVDFDLADDKCQQVRVYAWDSEQ